MDTPHRTSAIVRRRIPLLLLAALAHCATAGASGDDSTDLLASLSLEELLNTEITTLSRKSENLGTAPAAVHVVSQSDIRRSGARSIPELLRLVPGMQVAQIDANKWAVTSRGANGRFANKLLVLMDGRTIYNPLLSGVYWDAQDTDLSSIERIEIVRGPGATMWGSNAVNGVVNIITKHAADTQGETLAVSGGSNGNEATLRWGSATDRRAYRVFAKLSERNGNVDLAGNAAPDDADMFRLGGRYDWDGDGGKTLTISGEVYSGSSGDWRYDRSLTPPYEIITAADNDLSGGFLMALWSAELENGSSLNIRSYLNRSERDEPTFFASLDTFEVDLQHRLAIGEKHNLIWGLNYRTTRDEIGNSFQIAFSPTERTQNLVSAFVQDEVSLLNDRARLIFGSKFEYNTFSDSDVEIEPSVRMSYALSESATIWGSVSHAVRMPSRGELDGSIVTRVFPPGLPQLPLPVPLVATVRGNPSMESEEITAYEAGFRVRRGSTIFDLALFHNEFDKLRSLTAGAPLCPPNDEILALNPACVLSAPYVEAPLFVDNGADLSTTGAEVWLSQELSESWRLQLAYTYIRTREQDSGSGQTASLEIVEDSPDHQVSLRSSTNISQEVELDLIARWVDDLQQQAVDSYTALDIRLAWTPNASWNFALVGRNLFADDHLEFQSELVDLAPVLIEPDGYLEVRWNF